MQIIMTRMKRAAVVLLIIWILAMYIFISPLSSKDAEVAEIHDKFKRLSNQVEALKQQKYGPVDKMNKAGVSENLPAVLHAALLLEVDRGPSQEYEELRNRVYANVKEIWYYVNSELAKVMSLDNKIEKIQEVIAETGHRKRSLLSDIGRLQEADGFQEWRSREAANVSDLIQRRLKHLQNPPDCKQARKLVCDVNKGCGFGCQLHHIVYCLIFAYATERTLILNSKGWRYNPRGWDYVFYPISETCTTDYDDEVVPWPASDDSKVVSLPFIDAIERKPEFLPLTVPADLAKRIIRFNSDPSSWWIGQIVKFVLRPRPQYQDEIIRTIDKMNVAKPYVGVHIRRTDKVGSEAAFHHINEYMTHVGDYYDQLELTRPVDVRRVYLASDDVDVLADARSKFPSYEFYGDPSISSNATHKRYSPLSLTGLLVDLYLLSESDYLVCTFSSQVSRVAYEMMQTNRVDASDSFYSLDDIYYFGGQNAHDRRALLPHETHGDTVGFEVGDLIGVAGNDYNGYGLGTNKRTNQHGLIPWYKTEDNLVLYSFPEYKEVPLYTENKPKS